MGRKRAKFEGNLGLADTDRFSAIEDVIWVLCLY
jgi:hypothetical protein